MSREIRVQCVCTGMNWLRITRVQTASPAFDAVPGWIVYQDSCMSCGRRLEVRVWSEEPTPPAPPKKKKGGP